MLYDAVYVCFMNPYSVTQCDLFVYMNFAVGLICAHHISALKEGGTAVG